LPAHGNKLLGVSLAVALAAGVTAFPSIAAAADLNLNPRWPYVALNVAVFGALMVPVSRLMVRPLLQLFEERERRTAGSVEEAARLDAEAAAQRARLETQLAEARARAQARRAAILADSESQERALLLAASNDAAQTIETVRTAVSADLVVARAALQADARALAAEAATRLLGRPL
jgi:F-type H+-transporting ATPase subunit b